MAEKTVNREKYRVPPEVRARIEALKKVREQERMIRENMKKIRYRIAVLSGKGGVGKSFITASLGFALAHLGRKVGVFDADIYGPSIPRMMGVEGEKILATSQGRLLPVVAPLGVKVMSIGLMLPSTEVPVIWRGVLTTSAIREILAYTEWGELDYLLVDLPPGTGDEQLTIAEMLRGMLDGAIIVTIPSAVSKDVVVKALMFANKLSIRVLGVVENMSYFECPDGTRHYIFGEGAGKEIARSYNVELLAEIPIDPLISKASDSGEPFFIKKPHSNASKIIIDFAKRVMKKLSDE